MYLSVLMMKIVSEQLHKLYVYDTHYFVLIFQKIFHMIKYAFFFSYAYSETKEQKNVQKAFKKILKTKKILIHCEFRRPSILNKLWGVLGKVFRNLGKGFSPSDLSSICCKSITNNFVFRHFMIIETKDNQQENVRVGSC